MTQPITNQQQLVTELTNLAAEASRSRQMDSKILQERLQKISEVAKKIPVEPPRPPESPELPALVQSLRQATTLEELLQTAVHQVKNLLGLERVLVYTLATGTVIAEALEDGFTPTIGEKLPVVAFGKPVAKLYEAVVSCSDVHQEDLTPYQKQLMERFQVRALVTIPLMQDQQLWGILVGQQCLKTKAWQEQELKNLDRIRQELEIQLQIAVVKDTLNHQIQQENAFAGLFFRLNQLIGESLQQQNLDFYALFREITAELRTILATDRVAIYRFSADWSGEFIAESVKPGWGSVLEEQQKDEYLLRNTTTNNRCILKQLEADANPDADTYLQRTQGGEYTKGKPFTKVNDIYAMNFDPCYIKRLEKYQAKAYVIVPIFSNGKAWGLLAIYQNEGPRNWETTEVTFLQKVADQIGVAIQQSDNLVELRLKNEQISRDATRIADFSRLNYRVSELIAEGLKGESINTMSLFRDITQELRQILKVDRSAIYKFYADWSGEFIAESVGMGWISVLETQQADEYLQRNTTTNDRCILKKLQSAAQADVDTYLQRTQGGEYTQGKTFTKVDDIYAMNFDPCYIKRLEKYQAKAYIIVPIFQGGKAWGLLAIYQNDQPRIWEEGELTLLQQVAVQLGIVLLQSKYLEQIQLRSSQLSYIAELERALNAISDKMRQTQNVETIFKNVTQDLKQLFKVDRAAIYCFHPDWSGSFVAESVNPGWVNVVGTSVGDTYLQETKGGRYAQNNSLAVNNIYEAGHQQCHIEILEAFQAKAYVIVPVLQGEKLWGLLAIYQNANFRSWQQIEINSLAQIGAQLGVVIQQGKYIEQLSYIAELERALNAISDKMRQTQNVETIFKNVTQDLKQLFKVDRAAIYRFHPDWSGSFVAESVNPGWVNVVGTSVGDTYLQETKGGRYAQNNSLAVNNIYEVGHQQCHIEILEAFQAKAYVIVPVLQGEKLWGLLAIYQNANFRSWQQIEINSLAQVGTQLGVVIQQAEYLSQIQAQAGLLTEAADREKLARETLQRSALGILRAIEPSFRGDLTVRAPLSEDEIGTIADGYNTTIATLRDLVRQVQGAAGRVSKSSSSNTTAVTNLSAQAEEQVTKLDQALQFLQQMVQSVHAVNTTAQNVEQAVQESNRVVQLGDSLAELTVTSIMEVRETVSETAKKIKRLGESSQKISKVVNLIENFATQTNLLALNAAIESTRAGEYGRGFAVVADEVRSLAYQSANATTEIERLVQEIQAETNEVMEAMEVGISKVVKGSELVNETRQSLQAIAVLTHKISNLVLAITQATAVQEEQSQVVTQGMSDVAAIAEQTSVGAASISLAFQDLLATAQELEVNVSKFKVD